MSTPRAPRWATSSAAHDPSHVHTPSAASTPTSGTLPKDHATSTATTSTLAPTHDPLTKAGPSSRASSVTRDRPASSSRRSRAPPLSTGRESLDSITLTRVRGGGSTASPPAPPSATSNGTHATASTSEAGPSTPSAPAPPKKHRRGWKGWKIEVEDEFGNKILKSPSPEPELPPGAPKRPRGRPRTRSKPEDALASQQQEQPKEATAAQTSGTSIPDGAATQGEAQNNVKLSPSGLNGDADAQQSGTQLLPPAAKQHAPDNPQPDSAPLPTSAAEREERFHTPEIPMPDDSTAEAPPLRTDQESPPSTAKRPRDNTSPRSTHNSPEPPSKRSRTPRMALHVSTASDAATTAFAADATQDATSGVERAVHPRSRQRKANEEGLAGRPSRRPSHASAQAPNADTAQSAQVRSVPSRDTTPLPAAARQSSSSSIVDHPRASSSTFASSSATQKPAGSSTDTGATQEADTRQTGMGLGVYPSPPESDERGRELDNSREHGLGRQEESDQDADGDQAMEDDYVGPSRSPLVHQSIEVEDDDEEQDPETEQRLRDVVNEAEFIINATNLRRKEASDRQQAAFEFKQQAMAVERRRSRGHPLERELELERERERERELDRERERELERIRYERHELEYRDGPREREVRRMWETKSRDMEARGAGPVDWERHQWKERSLGRERPDSVRGREPERDRLWINGDDERRREERVWDRREYDPRREYERRPQPHQDSPYRPIRNRLELYDPIDMRDRRPDSRDSRDPREVARRDTVDMRDPWEYVRQQREQRMLTTRQNAASRSEQLYNLMAPGRGPYGQPAYPFAAGSSAAGYYPPGTPGYHYDPRDLRDARDVRDIRDMREPHDPRDLRDVRDAREARGSLDHRDNRDVHDLRDARDPRGPVHDHRDLRSPRDGVRDIRDHYDASDPRHRERRGSRMHERDDWYQRATGMQVALPQRQGQAAVPAKRPHVPGPQQQPPLSVQNASRRMSVDTPQAPPPVDSVRYPASPFVAPEPQVPDLAFEYPAIVLAPRGGDYEEPADPEEAQYARAHRDGFDGLTPKIKENSDGFIENVTNNLRVLTSTFFAHPSAGRDAFLEQVGRGLTILGQMLTDSADGALYTRPRKFSASESEQPAERARPLEVAVLERERALERGEHDPLPSGRGKPSYPRQPLPGGMRLVPRGSMADGPSGLHPDGMAPPSSSRRRVSDALDGPSRGGDPTIPRRSLPAVASGAAFSPILSNHGAPLGPIPGGRGGGKARAGGPRHSVPIAPKP